MKAKILIVDDEFIWQEIIKDILSERGYSIYAVGSYREAQKALSETLFHLTIIDLRLESSKPSDPEGLRLLEFIKKSETTLPHCIILTGYPSINFVKESFNKYKVWDFIPKLDFEQHSFLKTVEEAIVDASGVEASIGLEHHWQNVFSLSDSTNRQKSMRDLISFLASHLNLSAESHPVTNFKQWTISTIDVGSLFIERITSTIPVIALTSKEIESSIFEESLHAIKKSFPQPIYIFFILAKDTAYKQAIMPSINKMRRTFSYDLIPLDFQDLARILSSTTPVQKFKELLLAEINLEMISPFVTTGPVVGRIFFGRENNLRQIKEKIASQNYVLIGGRRIGKTSIVKQLEHYILPAAGFHTLYHDCSFTLTENELLRVIRDNRFWFSSKPIRDYKTFFEVVQELASPKPLVILLDEIDGIIKTDKQSGYAFLNSLRAIANSGYCHFVLCGESVLQSELTNANSPLFNFANEMIIGRLDFHAVVELVTQPMKQLEIRLIEEAQIVSAIWEFTSGHPNIIQRLCQRLIKLLNQRQNRQITPEDIQILISDPDFLRRDFLNVYWERATVLERLCSLIMAANQDTNTLIAVHSANKKHGIDVSLNQIDRALERLVELRNILKHTPTGYAFAVSAFPRVVNATSRFDDLIALNREAYQQGGDV